VSDLGQGRPAVPLPSGPAYGRAPGVYGDPRAAAGEPAEPVDGTTAPDPDEHQPGPGPGSEHKPEPEPDPGHQPEPETESRPEPLGVVLRETGNAEVDAAVARLADADELPTAGHVEVYEDVHRGLRDALTALDENRS
jgi:hypothetical protein